MNKSGGGGKAPNIKGQINQRRDMLQKNKVTKGIMMNVVENKGKRHP
jgi:hypothetical protein